MTQRFVVYDPRLSHLRGRLDVPSQAQSQPFVSEELRKKNRNSAILWKKALAYTKHKGSR